jgi:ketosteroid isomerase-like protein
VEARRFTKAQNVEVVQRLWAAIRMRRPQEIEPLLDEDVTWQTAPPEDPLRGREAVRRQLERITAPGAVEDSQPFSFEPVGGDAVVVSAALRRRSDGRIRTVNRWWVYRLRAGRIVHAANHASRESALAAARSEAQVR